MGVKGGATLAIGLVCSVVAWAESTEIDSQKEQVESMTKIGMTISGEQFTASINNSAAGKDFLSLLPITLTLEDYHSTEKISDLPKRLSTQDAAKGMDPQTGDITYFAPWGNLAIFYRDFGYSRGLVPLGKMDTTIEAFESKSPVTVTFERIE